MSTSQVGADHQASAVVAVRIGGADQRRQEGRCVRGRGDKRYSGWIVRERPGQPNDDGGVEAVAEPRDALADKEQEEVSLSEQCHAHQWWTSGIALLNLFGRKRISLGWAVRTEKRAQTRRHRGDLLGHEPIQDVVPLPAAVEQPGLGQDSEMLR